MEVTDMSQITIYGTATCQRCNALKNSLDRLHIKYDYVDIRNDNEAAQKLIDLGYSTLPVVCRNEFFASPSLEKMINFTKGV